MLFGMQHDHHVEHELLVICPLFQPQPICVAVRVREERDRRPVAVAERVQRLIAVRTNDTYILNGRISSDVWPMCRPHHRHRMGAAVSTAAGHSSPSN